LTNKIVANLNDKNDGSFAARRFAVMNAHNLKRSRENVQCESAGGADAARRVLRAPDAAQRAALAQRCAAEPGPRLLCDSKETGIPVLRSGTSRRIAPVIQRMIAEFES
jgi:hypothetical protein